jgi:hypothetical protein
MGHVGGNQYETTTTGQRIGPNGRSCRTNRAYSHRESAPSTTALGYDRRWDTLVHTAGHVPFSGVCGLGQRCGNGGGHVPPIPTTIHCPAAHLMS